MAKETGGGTFEVSKRGLEEIYAEIEDALRNQYCIRYQPERGAKPGSYHKLKLLVKDRN